MGKTKAIETLEEQQEVLASLVQFGLDETVERLDFAEEAILNMLGPDGFGLSEEQIGILRESSAFREGTFADGTAQIAPELQTVLDNVFEISNEVVGSVRAATDPILDRRGRTERTGQAADRFEEIAQGRLPSQQTREEVGREIFGQRGQTSGTRQVRDRGLEVLNTRGFGGMPDLERTVRTGADIVATGGETAKTNELFRLGADLIANNGFTAENRQVMDFVLDSLNNGLPTPEIDATVAKLNRIIDSGGEQGAGIIPVNEFLGFARSQAANTALQLARAAQEDAVRRGLTPGAVSAGTSPQDTAGEAILRNEGETTFQAVAENQRLRAQAVSGAFDNLTDLFAIQRNDPRVGAFASLLGSTIQASTQNIRTGAELGTNAAALENERLGIGMQGVLQGSSIAAQREASARAGVLGAEEMELNRLMFGANLLGQNVQERLQGTAGLLQTDAQEQGNFFNAINAQLGAGQFGVNSNLSAGNLVLGNQQQQIGAFLSSLGLSADVAQQGQGNVLQGASLLGNFAIPFLQFGANAMNNQTSLAGQQAQIQSQPGLWARMLQTGFGAAVGAAAGQFLPSSDPGRFTFSGGQGPAPEPTAVNPLGGLNIPELNAPLGGPINLDNLTPAPNPFG